MRTTVLSALLAATAVGGFLSTAAGSAQANPPSTAPAPQCQLIGVPAHMLAYALDSNDPPSNPAAVALYDLERQMCPAPPASEPAPVEGAPCGYEGHGRWVHLEGGNAAHYGTEWMCDNPNG
ncbi:hypothetical protein [Nocardia sp. NPDC050406]|uniref:hypothetical protein n=1 Tax=Nocardia sp. NPDC050406 TaxID=3364318 RepID=UPI0037B97781